MVCSLTVTATAFQQYRQRYLRKLGDLGNGGGPAITCGDTASTEFFISFFEKKITKRRYFFLMRNDIVLIIKKFKKNSVFKTNLFEAAPKFPKAKKTFDPLPLFSYSRLMLSPCPTPQFSLSSTACHNPQAHHHLA